LQVGGFFATLKKDSEALLSGEDQRGSGAVYGENCALWVHQKRKMRHPLKKEGRSGEVRVRKKKGGCGVDITPPSGKKIQGRPSVRQTLLGQSCKREKKCAPH